MTRFALARQADLPEGEGPDWLDGAERARAGGLRPEARAAFVASRVLLRRLLQAHTGVAADRWGLTAQAGAAPRAWRRDGAGAGPGVSLSHRLGWVAAAVCGQGAVGIDVECSRPGRSGSGYDARAALMLGPAELADWEALPQAARPAALLEAWSVKEAWFKATPAGGAPWDFRRLQVRACTPGQAAVRSWRVGEVVLALCCAEPASALCAGMPDGLAAQAHWRVERLGGGGSGPASA